MVLDGDTRIALAIVRSLGKCGIKVIVGGPKKSSRAFYSRYCREFFVYPVDPGGGETAACILENIKKYKPDVLFPVLNKSFDAVIRNKIKISQHTKPIPLPDLESFRSINDKSVLIQTAQKIGIPAPRTWYPLNEQEAFRIFSRNNVRCVLKPKISAGGFGTFAVNSLGQLSEAFSKLKRLRNICMPDVFFNAEQPILQEYLTGDVTTFFAYCERGRLQNIYMTKTLRNYPLPFGPGVCVCSIKNDSILNFSSKLLAHFNWNGIIGLQYIIDKTDGIPKLIDANPRFWGTLESAINSGVNFPKILFEKALGRKVYPNFNYHTNRKFRWLLIGDFMHLIKSRNKHKALMDFVGDAYVQNEIDWKDAAPHFRQLLNIIMHKQDFR